MSKCLFRRLKTTLEFFPDLRKRSVQTVQRSAPQLAKRDQTPWNCDDAGLIWCRKKCHWNVVLLLHLCAVLKFRIRGSDQRFVDKISAIADDHGERSQRKEADRARP